MTKRIHISVAWPYANGDIHVGHLAGAYLPADIFARYHRLRGNQVLMVSGSDSHGTPITVEADKRGVEPRQVFEQYHERFLETLKGIGVSYDLFTHTDTENHHRVAQDIFLRLNERGYLYREVQRQLYSENEGRFLPDRYIEGTCPICGYEEARGDQCDNCGNLLDALDLINPRSKTDGSQPVIRETEHFFIDLPALADSLLDYLNQHQDHWRPNVINFARNFVEGGLKGRAVTRDIEWGIPVPLEGWQDKRLYVWFEAVMGYLTASIEWSELKGNPDAWKQWWYDPEARGYVFIGKDNIPFHTIFWQAQLIGMERLYEADETLRFNLPYDVAANEFLNIQGAQLSKSRNWAVWVPDLLERYDADAIRFYLTSVMPETRDSEFSWPDFISRNNDELVATWGNLANRVLSFTYKHWDGQVPETTELTPEGQALVDAIAGGFDQVGEQIEQVNLRAGLQTCLALARQVNGFLDRAPWFGAIDSDREAAAKTVSAALQAINDLKLLFSPYLPFSAQELHTALGFEDELFGELRLQQVEESNSVHNVLTYDPEPGRGSWQPQPLPAGQRLGEPKPLFTKLDPDAIEAEQAQLGS